jgi:glycosidase
MIPTPSVEAARRLRPSGPFHLPPTAQPIRTSVELAIEDAPSQPEVVLRDIRRDISWRVAMTATASRTWTAQILLPSVPTIVRYHFEFPDGSTLLELRQHEGRNVPIYGEWEKRQFQIAAYDPNAMPAEWTLGQVIYQIFPDRFAIGDRAKVKPDRSVYGQEPFYLMWTDKPEHPPKGRDFYGGDLRGLIERLDYLADLGIDCVYLCPIFESPSNHRYDTVDYLRIDPLLGTEQDLTELIDKAHAHNIKIMLDAVFNHCSCDSRYFNLAGLFGDDIGAAQTKESPYYRWFEFKNWPKEYDGWIGLRHMPEFVECPEVEEFFIGPQGVAVHWLERGIDGWRTDVTRWVTDEFWRRFRRAVRAVNPAVYLVAEEWEDASHYLLGDLYDATMNYRFAWAVQGFLAVDKLSPSELDDRLEMLRRDTPPPAVLAQMNLIDSHDTARALTVCGGDKRRFLQMVAFQLAYPGAPMIYYGDEAGLQGDYAESGRRAFPWGGEDADVLPFYRRALAFRRQSKALRLGNVESLVINDDQRVYVFARRLDDEAVYVAFNASDKPAKVEIQLRAGEDGAWHDALDQHPNVESVTGTLSIEITPHGAAWYCR